MKTTVEDSILLQNGLVLRFEKGTLLFDWKSNCNYLDLVVERHICAGITDRTASLWLQGMEADMVNNETGANILLEKSPQGLSLAFTRTFLNPKGIQLSAIAQEKLKVQLQDFLRSPSDHSLECYP